MNKSNNLNNAKTKKKNNKHNEKTKNKKWNKGT